MSQFLIPQFENLISDNLFLGKKTYLVFNINFIHLKVFELISGYFFFLIPVKTKKVDSISRHSHYFAAYLVYTTAEKLTKNCVHTILLLLLIFRMLRTLSVVSYILGTEVHVFLETISKTS